ncbi:hypothetical protein IIZ77_00155 [Candidatus Saccharibacteria bacterium]|nr:hypothetical protein [Candidatus Saccharibacteria bacterium]
MEQMMNQNTNMEMNMDTGAAKKQGKGMMFGMIACAILAVAGISFGIYEMSQVKTAKQQIADLKIEVKKDDGSTTTIETDQIEVKEADKTVVITDSAKTREDGYFYFDEWGIKVKLPEDFYITGYRAVSRMYGIRNIDKGSYAFWGGIRAENSDGLVANDPIEHVNSPLFTINRYDKEMYEAQKEDAELPAYLRISAKIVYTGEDYVIGITPRLTPIIKQDGSIDENLNNNLNMAEEWGNNGTAFFDPSNYSAI